MNTVRLAIIGAGSMGRKHAELICASDMCSLVGICDVDPKRKSVAEELNVPFYPNTETLLEREQPEGAIIATPNASHSSNAEICAKRSVHVLIEKPITDTIDEAHRIIKAADDCGIHVLIGHHRRYNPLIKKTRSLVQGDALGKLVAVSVLWTLLKPADYYNVDWRCKRPGGGPVLINLIHELDSLRFICGEIRQVYTQSSSLVRSLAVEDSLSITLSFKNGALASILASDATPAPWSYEATTHENPYYFHTDENCCHFFGTSGSLAFPRMEIWSYANKDQIGWQYPIEMSRCTVQDGYPLVLQLEHFCRVVRGEEKPLVDGRNGARSLAVVLAVLESAQRHAPVNVHE